MQAQEIGARLVSDFSANLSSIGDLFAAVIIIAAVALVASHMLKRRGLSQSGKFRGWG